MTQVWQLSNDGQSEPDISSYYPSLIIIITGQKLIVKKNLKKKIQGHLKF
jgi:hypothetical protein